MIIQSTRPNKRQKATEDYFRVSTKYAYNLPPKIEERSSAKFVVGFTFLIFEEVEADFLVTSGSCLF